ncbi:MAG: hypothetical protein HUK20_06070 [Fibrobacter sp.]|nr:hypothetical protein [Fibrobacter sp.]
MSIISRIKDKFGSLHEIGVKWTNIINNPFVKLTFGTNPGYSLDELQALYTSGKVVVCYYTWSSGSGDTNVEKAFYKGLFYKEGVQVAIFEGPLYNHPTATSNTSQCRRIWYDGSGVNGWGSDTNYVVADWDKINGKPNKFTPSDHEHSPGDITNGTGNFSISGEIINSKGNIWLSSIESNMVYKITLDSKSYQNNPNESLFISTSESNGWPIVFQVSWRWNGSEWLSSPRLSYLYTTSYLDSSKTVDLKFTESGSIYICLNSNQAKGYLLCCMSSPRAKDCGFGNVSKTSSEYSSATKVTNNIEGCVYTSAVGEEVGNENNPVFMNKSGFLQKCTYSIKIYDAGSIVPYNPNEISFLRSY